MQIPQRLLGEALLISSRKVPDKVAVISKGREYTYSELEKEVKKMAGYLTQSGIKKGDCVAVYMNNSWHCIVAIYAISLAGGVFLIINPQTKADKLLYILNDSKSKILFAEGNLLQEASSAIKGATSVIELIVSAEAIKDASPDIKIKTTLFIDAINFDHPFKGSNTIPVDLAALIYTSGSTGFPKGVMMTHQAMVFTSWSLIQYLRLTEDERILLLLPLAFDYGLYQLLMTITIGGTLIVEESFIYTATIYKHIEEYKPTVFPGVPTIYAMMIAGNKKSGISFNSIKKVTNTAAALPAEFIPDLKKLFPNALIFKMYGLTECKRVCYLEPELVDVKPNSVGKAIPGTEVFLLTPDGSPTPVGEPGILHVRGPHVMLGYLNKKELSEEMLKDGRLPGEKVLCSNDWFKMDEDGDLYFLGRNDDIIKTRGEKVSPIEVEKVIYKIPGIKEVAVLGMPDFIMGEIIVAFVTLFENLPITEKDIQRECMSKLENFMVPQKIIFLDEMPKSSNGKIDKKTLKIQLNE